MTTHQNTAQDAPTDLAAEDIETPRQAVQIAVVQMVATWAVQRALSFGYRRLTGRDEPTARDADVPLRRILAWAAASAAAANVVVDRLVLRRRAAATQRP